MYSPKIDEKYIPTLYRLAKERQVTMKKLVNEMIEAGIKQFERRKTHADKPSDRHGHGG